MENVLLMFEHLNEFVFLKELIFTNFFSKFTDSSSHYYPARTYANVWLHANFKDVNISLQSLYCFSQKKIQWVK